MLFTNNKYSSIKLTFIAITLFYFFETAQMSYFTVLAPTYLHFGIYNHNQIATLSASYYYGDMLGLLPVGLALDKFPLRKTLLWAILGSIVGAFILLISDNFYMQWSGRFLSGFLGGTFSFLGGIHIINNTFKKRFTLFMGLFIGTGMFGAASCQYPLLMAVNAFGIPGPMRIMFLFGIMVAIFNFIYLHPQNKTETLPTMQLRRPNTTLKAWLTILSNTRNWLDCLMIVLLETPNTILGTLWGIVLLINFYHFSSATSALIITMLFLGQIIGCPLWGELADRYQHRASIIVLGSGLGFLVGLALLLLHTYLNAAVVALLFAALGFFSIAARHGELKAKARSPR